MPTSIMVFLPFGLSLAGAGDAGLVGVTGGVPSAAGAGAGGGAAAGAGLVELVVEELD
jgi:hypothetical protein